MMKKKFLILPVLAALFAACTSDELVVVDNQTQQTEEDAIAFDAYLTRSVTRAGKPGNLTTSSTDAPNISLQNEGFGVFAYYANGDLYSENAIPDFMYNQKVSGATWTYSPIKYWPNEFGSSAISTGVDRLTFFAYAPYVTVEPSTGQLTSHYDNSTTELSTETGITALTRNGKTGDPYVRYVSAFDPAKCVDLCYGVAAADYTSAVGAADGANKVKKGDPYLNIAKPAIDSKIFFDFKHALAKLNVQIDADVDIAGHSVTETAVNSLTRIWVRSITFDGIAQRGYLNLNSGMWYDVIDNTKISHASVTVHDGRRDGAEAIADDSYETPIGLNNNLVQNVVYTMSTAEENGLTVYSDITTPAATRGVTKLNQNLFGGTGNLLVIPANEQLKVTIVYDVETADASLSSFLSDGATKGSTVENKITKSIILDGTPLKLEAGKAYTLNLHLGMNSVKFDAAVSDWEDVTGADENLPANVRFFTAAAAGTGTATISYDATSYEFGINGLTGNEAITATVGAHKYNSATGAYDGSTAYISGWSVTQNAANYSGYSIQTLTTTENPSTCNRTQVVTMAGSGGKKVDITFTQAAHPIGLQAPAIKTAGTEAQLRGSFTNGTGSSGFGYFCKGLTDNCVVLNATSNGNPEATTPTNGIAVYRNGTKLTLKTSPSVAGEYSFTDAGLITFGATTAAGDIIKVVLKTGDAAPETVTWTVVE